MELSVPGTVCLGALGQGVSPAIIISDKRTQELSHPKYEHEKEYEVSLQESPSESQLEQLRDGVEIATGTTYPAQVKQRDGKVRITIHEGKKRQVRRMFTTVGLTITNLKRIRINKLTLPKELPLGQFKLIGKEEIL